MEQSVFDRILFAVKCPQSLTNQGLGGLLPLIAENDRGALESAMKKLGELASVHIYFQLLYVHCYYRQTAILIRNDRGSAEDAKLLDELRQLPEQLPLYQQQVQRFFDLVLDVDSAGREPQAQVEKNYTYDAPNDPALQKLWALLCTDRARQRGVLRAACSGWSAALPGHRCAEAVDASAGR